MVPLNGVVDGDDYDDNVLFLSHQRGLVVKVANRAQPSKPRRRRSRSYQVPPGVHDELMTQLPLCSEFGYLRSKSEMAPGVRCVFLHRNREKKLLTVALRSGVVGGIHTCLGN